MNINLIEMFEESVAKNPQKIAVIDKDRSITFSALRQQAMLLAQKIIDTVGCQNKPIAVFLDKSIECVYSDLGILYSGNFYMNLDIYTPTERIGNILKLVEPCFIISSSKQIQSIANVIPAHTNVILLDDETQAVTFDDTVILSRISKMIDTDPSCIINTSGSKESFSTIEVSLTLQIGQSTPLSLVTTW